MSESMNQSAQKYFYYCFVNETLYNSRINWKSYLIDDQELPCGWAIKCLLVFNTSQGELIA